MKQVKFVLLEVGTKEELREYYSLNEAFKDLFFKAPESFWIGIVEEKQAYTIDQFLDKYKNEYEEFQKSFLLR